MRLQCWQGNTASGYPFSCEVQGAAGVLAYTAGGAQCLKRDALSRQCLAAWSDGLTAPLWLQLDQQAPAGSDQLAPYMRELGGCLHSLMIGADLPGIYDAQRFPLEQFKPLGYSEGERAACWLFKRLASVWQEALAPQTDVVLAILADYAARIRGLGAADFIYSDGHELFVHCDQLTLAWRHSPGGLEVCSDPAQRSGWESMQAQGLYCFSEGQLQGVYEDKPLQLLAEDEI